MRIWSRWGPVAIVAAFCILGVIYSVVIPLFEAPDEIWHFSFARVLAAQRRLPVQSTEGKNVWLREAGQPPLYYLVAAPVIVLQDTSDFPDFVRFNAAHPAVTPGSESDSPNVFIHTSYEKFPYQGAALAVHFVRLLSVVWGAMAVTGTYLLAREVVPSRTNLALFAASITAFNPHFIFISSVVNNDACAAAVCVLALWLTVRVVRESQETGFARKHLVSASVLGFVLGLALLTKMSALALLPLVVLALALIWWRDRDLRALLMRGAVVFGLAGLIGGWWYVRNWLLYGDPLGWGIWLMDIPVVRIGLIELVHQFGHVAASYWSPYDGLFPPEVFWALSLLAVLAVAGLLKLSVRRGAWAGEEPEGLILAGTWVVLLFLSLVRYMRTTPSDEGRLLFPGIAALSLFLALGLEAFVPQRWASAVATIAGVGLLILGVAIPFGAIAPRYASPLVTATEGFPMAATFENAIFVRRAEDGQVRELHLLGMGMSPDVVQSGEMVDVKLYWEARSPPPVDLRAIVQIWTVGGRFLGQRDTTPAGEIYPPDLWQQGDVVRDVYRIRIDGDGPAVCRVVVHVLAGDKVLGEVSSPGILKLAGKPVSAENLKHRLIYTLGSEVELVGFSLPDGALTSARESLAVTFYWRALAEMSEDYTVFVHLFSGGEGTLMGQGDGPPLSNDYPTSYWAPDELLLDTHVVGLTSPPSLDAYLLVGMYRLADGTRLPAYTATGERVPNDAIRLDLYDEQSAEEAQQ